MYPDDYEDEMEGVDSDYECNLLEVYENGGNEEDIAHYRGIHLMGKEYV